MEGQDEMDQGGQHAFHAENGSQSDLPPPQKRQRVSQVCTNARRVYHQKLRRCSKLGHNRILLTSCRHVGRVETGRLDVMAVSPSAVLARPEAYQTLVILIVSSSE